MNNAEEPESKDVAGLSPEQEARFRELMEGAAESDLSLEPAGSDPDIAEAARMAQELGKSQMIQPTGEALKQASDEVTFDGMDQYKQDEGRTTFNASDR
jgi:hypothetical protein